MGEPMVTDSESASLDNALVIEKGLINTVDLY